jgi:hypothetical protein
MRPPATSDTSSHHFSTTISWRFSGGQRYERTKCKHARSLASAKYQEFRLAGRGSPLPAASAKMFHLLWGMAQAVT